MSRIAARKFQRSMRAARFAEVASVAGLAAMQHVANNHVF